MTTNIIQKKIYPLIEKEKALVIKSPEDVKTATTLLSGFNKIVDAVVEEKNKVLEPLNKARTAEINRWKPIILLYEPHIDSLRQKLSDYQTLATKEHDTKANAIADRIGEGKGSLKMETAMKKIDSLEKPQEKVATEQGTITFRAIPKLVITSLNDIPREYLIPDEKKILEALKAGQEVKGARIDIIQVPVNNR